MIEEKIFAEIGFGNGTLLSTEIEKGKNEKRFKGFIKPKKINDLYFRLWIFKIVFVISFKDGFKLIKKPRNKFKILFGLGGTN